MSRDVLFYEELFPYKNQNFQMPPKIVMIQNPSYNDNIPKIPFQIDPKDCIQFGSYDPHNFDFTNEVEIPQNQHSFSQDNSSSSHTSRDQCFENSDVPSDEEN